MAALDDKSLYEYLLKLGVIDKDLLFQKFELSRINKLPLQDILISDDLIPDEDLGRIISDISGFPLIKLSATFIPDDILNTISKEIAQKYRVIAFGKKDNQLSLAMENPSQSDLILVLEKRLNLKITPFIATRKDIEDAIDKYSMDVSKTFKTILETASSKKGKLGEELPVEEIQTAIINYAYNSRASDIHIEPMDEGAIVRVRIDGVLHDILKIDKTLMAQLVNRIKFLANLRTDEHLTPQDGKLVFKTKENLDIRISIVPTVQGETISMRLLSERARQFGLSDLGLTEENLTKITKAYKKPYGMILSAGPTGSGKTTTLYSIVKLLNNRAVKIMTIEDPVEYEIPGVNQIQVNAKTNLTFAEGLRSIARQDPDIILVGEIRDEETAGIAVNSALTGHIVLSTLHANDASTAFPRLLDFKIEPFLIASTVNLVIAQRLVRKICTGCRTGMTMDAKVLKDHFPDEDTLSVFGDTTKIDVYKGKGCPLCYGTGYLGRIGIFEVMEIDDSIRQAIKEKLDSESIRQTAMTNGMKTMNWDALQKVKQGITTIEEVIRTTKE